MAKRFTDTDKWKKPFMKTLPAEYKLFWLYLLDSCDNAGIWHVEMEVAETRLGIKLSIERIRGLFKERVVEFDNGTKMFLPDFVEFQYGPLNIQNNAHKSVLDKLTKYNLQGLISPSRGAMDKDKEMDMDKEERRKNENLVYDAEEFMKGKQKELESICMSTHRTMDQALAGLTKYHLWLEREGKYPINRKAAASGFKLWLMNEKPGIPTAGGNKYEDELTRQRKAYKTLDQ